jgi:adenylyltransferase/sulfurtransferase
MLIFGIFKPHLPAIYGCSMASMEKPKRSHCNFLKCHNKFTSKFCTFFRREKMAGCAICSERPKITELQDYEKFCGSGPTDKAKAGGK